MHVYASLLDHQSVQQMCITKTPFNIIYKTRPMNKKKLQEKELVKWKKDTKGQNFNTLTSNKAIYVCVMWLLLLLVLQWITYILHIAYCIRIHRWMLIVRLWFGYVLKHDLLVQCPKAYMFDVSSSYRWISSFRYGQEKRGSTNYILLSQYYCLYFWNFLLLFWMHCWMSCDCYLVCTS